MRKLKYKLSKEKSLSRLYCTYIRLLLEYASEILDGCNIADAKCLERVRLNADRVVTGLPVLTSIRSLYFETGQETLADRSKQVKHSYK